MELRKGSNQVLTHLVFQLNALRDVNVGGNFHAQVTPSGPPGDDPAALPAALAITAANSSNLATAITLANDVLRVLQAHFKDMAAHKTVQSPVINLTDLASTAVLATVQTRANALKAAYEAHRLLANVHFTNDGTNTLTQADASDQTTLNALLNEMKTDINAHVAAGLAGQHIVLIDS